MTSYFNAHNSKSALKTNQTFSSDGSRPDLLLEQYALSRDRLLTVEKVAEINDMYMKWCDLLFSGFNVVVIGGQSKYSLLETFKKKYLDIGPIPDFRGATGFNDDYMAESKKPKEKSSRRKANVAPLGAATGRRTTRSRNIPDSVETPTSTEPKEPAPMIVDPEFCPMINVVTVRIHGFEPIKQEAFNHAVFEIKESRRPKESDYIDFIKQVKAQNQHYVFLIHSFEYFLNRSEDVCETIYRLYSMDPVRIHLLMSADVLNGGKKLHNLKIQLRMYFFKAPFTESYFWEKSQQMGHFDEGENAHNETTVHRLFTDKTDLQSLKDIYQALDGATASILEYIFKDYVQKCEADQAKDEDEEDFVPLGLVADNSGDEGQLQNRMQPKRRAKARSKQPRKSCREKLGTHLDFHHLLKYCESQFIIRRGVALRDHLGELKDHRIVSEDAAGNKIQCLVEVPMCKKFLEWLATQKT